MTNDHGAFLGSYDLIDHHVLFTHSHIPTLVHRKGASLGLVVMALPPMPASVA